MMRLLTPWIACYLALCFAFAGAVGVSPGLHRLVEHVGQGPAHTHFGFRSQAASAVPLHQHGDGRWHTDAEVNPRPAGLFQHSSGSFQLPDVSRLWHGLSRLFEQAASSESSPSKGVPAHEHHSLFQLMASGLVDQPLLAEILPSIPLASVSLSFVANAPFVARDWDAQTSSRGPPSSGS